MPTYSTNFGWPIPIVGSDGNTWGYYLNTTFTAQDMLIRDGINTFLNSSPPSIAQSGTLWIDSTTNPWILKVYSGTTWIEIGYINTLTNTFSSPNDNYYIGDMKYSAQTTDHGKWLLCDGRSLSTTTYSGLFAVVSYNYGGAGPTFNIPDLRCLVAGGVGTNSPYTTRTYGEVVGEETHTLTTNEMPSHNHTFNPRAENSLQATTPGVAVGTSNRTIFGFLNNTTFIENAGGDEAHNNMQPTGFMGNYFIYTGV